MATTTKLKLHTMLGNYPNTKPLKSGAIRSDLIDFDFVEVKVANNLFKQVVRDAKYDVAELAIVTYLQAKAYGKPYVLVPAVVVSRGQHHTIAYNPDRGALKPSDLNGKRVGVRAYTVTTGTWLRGMLASDYGVDINKVEWITFEDPHVAEYHDPAIVKRAPAGKDLTQMLLDGEVAAGIVGDKLPTRNSSISFPTPMRLLRNGPSATTASQSITCSWSEKNSRDHGPTWSRTSSASCTRANWPPVCLTVASLIPIVSVSRPAGPILEIIIDFCHQQMLIPRRMSVDELFDDTTRDLGVA